MNEHLQSRSVLVMDDDEDVRFVVEYLLARQGFTVVLTSSGSEAVERYRSALEEGTPFHAVILDITIPGSMGGHDVLKLLKEIDPRVTAFISSGNPFDPLMANPTAYGFSGALAKPFHAETLHMLLNPEPTG